MFEKIFHEFIEPDVYEPSKAPAPSASPFTVKCTHCEDGSDKHEVLCQDGGGGEIERMVPEPAYANPFQPLPLPNHHPPPSAMELSPTFSRSSQSTESIFSSAQSIWDSPPTVYSETQTPSDFHPGWSPHSAFSPPSVGTNPPDRDCFMSPPTAGYDHALNPPLPSSSPPAPSGLRPWTCLTCGKGMFLVIGHKVSYLIALSSVIKNYYKRNQHLDTHKPRDKHPCDQCPRTYYRPNDLKRHQDKDHPATSTVQHSNLLVRASLVVLWLTTYFCVRQSPTPPLRTVAA